MSDEQFKVSRRRWQPRRRSASARTGTRGGSPASEHSEAVSAALPASIESADEPLRRGLKVLGWIIGALALLFLLWSRTPLSPVVFCLALVSAALAGIPMVLWYAKGGQGVPAFELICVSYFLHYGISVFLQDPTVMVKGQPVTIPQSRVAITLAWVILGLGCMLAGYYSFGSFTRRLPEIKMKMPESELPTLAFVSCAVGGLFLFGASRIELSPAWQFLLSAPFNFGLGLLTFVGLTRGGFARIGSIVLTGFAVFWGLSTGMLEKALVPVVIYFLVRWQAKRKFPLYLFITATVLFVPLNASKYAFRADVWSAPSQMSRYQQVRDWFQRAFDTSGELLREALDRDARGTIRDSLNRFDFIHPFAYITSVTPESIPRLRGSTYQYLLYGWIPRKFWPNKPGAYEANLFYASEYLQMPERVMESAMFGIGHLTEAYVNFGLFGFSITMLLHGVFYRALVRVFHTATSAAGMCMLIVTISWLLNGIGSATAGALFQVAGQTLIVVGIVASYTLVFVGGGPDPQPSRKGVERPVA